ncbi:MFS transporter [Oscillospiraceae bacterium WX1]
MTQRIGGPVGNPFAALRHKSFLFYWIGMAVSTTGTWMQNIAQPWLAYRLTNSPFLLSLVSAMQYVPVLLFSLAAGVLIDRYNKKSLLFMTQTASLLITLITAVLSLFGVIRFWHLMVMSTLLGIVNTIDMPVRQAFVIELVGKEDLTNGIALNSVQFNFSRIIGPAVAGIVMARWGVTTCFFVNAVSFGAVIVSLFLIKPYSVEKTQLQRGRLFANIADGLGFIYHDRYLFITFLILAVTGTFAMNFNVLVPVFAIQTLHQQEMGFGLLMSFAGVGALTGALTVASLSQGGPKKAIIFAFPVIVAVILMSVGWMTAYTLAGLILALVSFFFMIFMASANATFQMHARQEYRGRVMSVYTLVFVGTTPLGNLFSGAIADRFGAGAAFAACGAAVLLLLVPIYIIALHQGILASGSGRRPFDGNGQ